MTQTSTTKITKGDTVLMVSSWDNRGTVVVQRFAVGSWGKKQGHLLHEDGTLGKQIDTANVNSEEPQYRFRHHIAREDAIANVTDWALAYGVQYLAAKRADIERCLAKWGDNVAYRKSVEADLDSLLATPVILSEIKSKGQVVPQGGR